VLNWQSCIRRLGLAKGARPPSCPPRVALARHIPRPPSCMVRNSLPTWHAYVWVSEGRVDIFVLALRRGGHDSDPIRRKARARACALSAGSTAPALKCCADFQNKTIRGRQTPTVPVVGGASRTVPPRRQQRTRPLQHTRARRPQLSKCSAGWVHQYALAVSCYLPSTAIASAGSSCGAGNIGVNLSVSRVLAW
jgi:hypothetical protein